MSTEDKNKDQKGKDGADKQTPPPAQSGKQQPPKVPFNYNFYWLEYIKNTLDNTLPNIEKHHKSYTDFLDALSIATFIGGTALAAFYKTTDFWVYACIYLPVAILQWAKYKIKIEHNNLPTTTIEDIRSPKQIHQAHNMFVEKRRENLKNAKPWVKWATLAYLVLVPIGIYRNNTLKKTAAYKKFTNITYSNGLVEVSALVPKANNFSIILEGKDVADNKKSKKVAIQIPKDSLGLIRAKIYPKTQEIIPTEISLSYEKDGNLHSFTYKPLGEITSTASSKKKLTLSKPKEKKDSTTKVSDSIKNTSKKEKKK